MERHERGYENEFISFKTERLRREEAGYSNEVKVRASTLVAIGEDPNYIASLLDIDGAVVTNWFRTIILNTADLTLREDEYSFIREMNVIRADARTIGCMVKGVIEGIFTEENAKDLVGVSDVKIIKTWIQKFRRDYDHMLSLPPGVEYKIRPTYVLGLDSKNELQELIFSHDREENALSARRREEYLTSRRT